MNTVEDLNRTGYRFEPSEYFSAGWKLLSKHFGPLVGMTLLFLIIGIVISSIPVVSSFSNLISLILTAGYYIFLFNSRSNKNDAKDFFGGFKFAVDIVLHRLVLLLFLLPFILLLFLVGFPFLELFQVITQAITPEDFGAIIAAEIGENFGVFFLFVFLVALAGLYLEISYLFTLPLIVTGKMKFWEAMETSRKIVGQRFFSYFFSLLILGIILVIGVVVTCGLGVLIALPVYSCVVFCAYESIFKPHDDLGLSELDEFGNAPSDVNSESEL